MVPADGGRQFVHDFVGKIVFDAARSSYRGGGARRGGVGRGVGVDAPAASPTGLGGDLFDQPGLFFGLLATAAGTGAGGLTGALY
jgi:hypothetical protein